MARKTRFTIFDAAETAGVFEANPANVGARDKEGNNTYLGPVEFPKILYHPTGETKIIVNGTWENTPNGPKFVGELSEMIWRLVSNGKEEKELKTAGWHDHPAKAIAEGNKGREKPLAVPPISSAQTIEELQRALAKTQEQLKIAELNQKITDEPPVPTLAEKLKTKTAELGLA